MTKTFVPHVPEERVIIEVTRSEAIVIQELRAFSFGKLTIHKANNTVVRVEPNISKMINDKLKLTIPIVE